MSNDKLREQVRHLALFANSSKNLDNVVEEVLNFVRNENKNAILLKDLRKQNESLFSKREGKTSTKLSKR